MLSWRCRRSGGLRTHTSDVWDTHRGTSCRVGFRSDIISWGPSATTDKGDSASLRRVTNDDDDATPVMIRARFCRCVVCFFSPGKDWSTTTFLTKVHLVNLRQSSHAEHNTIILHYTQKNRYTTCLSLGKYWDPSGREVGRYASLEINIRYSRTHRTQCDRHVGHLMHSYTYKEETRVHASRPYTRRSLTNTSASGGGGDTEEPSATRQRPTIYYIRGGTRNKRDGEREAAGNIKSDRTRPPPRRCSSSKSPVRANVPAPSRSSSSAASTRSWCSAYRSPRTRGSGS